MNSRYKREKAALYKVFDLHAADAVCQDIALARFPNDKALHLVP